MISILIVDDAAFMRMMISNFCRDNGFRVVAEAENGLHAIERYKEHNPDVVLMDITMPEMNGIDAVKAIKQIDCNAKIIMCSAMGQQSMVIEAIQAGASDFVVKPFQPDRVIDALKRATK